MRLKTNGRVEMDAHPQPKPSIILASILIRIQVEMVFCEMFWLSVLDFHFPLQLPKLPNCGQGMCHQLPSGERTQSAHPQIQAPPAPPQRGYNISVQTSQQTGLSQFHQSREKITVGHLGEQKAEFSQTQCNLSFATMTF